MQQTPQQIGQAEGYGCKWLKLGTPIIRKLKVEINVNLTVELDANSNKVSALRSEKLLGVVCNDTTLP